MEYVKKPIREESVVQRTEVKKVIANGTNYCK